MAQRQPQSVSKKQHTSTARRGAEAGELPSVGLPAWAWLGGAGALLVAGASSGALVWQHFSGKFLPGCGPQSGCASIESHPMGRVPFPKGMADVLGFPAWPASFLGVTFFVAVLTFWLLSARLVPALLRVSVWIGILASIAYLVAIAVSLSGGGESCKYCLASHGANFALLAFMEVGIMLSRSGDRSAGSVRGRLGTGPLVAAIAVFATATGVLGYYEHAKVSREAAVSEAARKEAERAMLAQAAQQSADAANAQKAPPIEAWNFGPQGFTGRYREGPEQAVARIVIFSDYQCHQCKRIENEARALRARFPATVSISHKHFPWCADCNKTLGGKTLHANACWAARAAETAAILKGNDGFWQMHRWLFDRGGGFTDQELNDGLTALGFDPKVFVPVMTGEGTLRPVLQDVDEAQALGISGTPMVFINGIELKGWEAPRALERTVEAVINSGAAAATSAADRPVLAREKYIADWREEVVQAQAAGNARHEIRNDTAHVEVVVFGDFLEPNTAKIDALLRDLAARPTGAGGGGGGGKPIRYVFRHYPGDMTCNTSLKKTFFEHGCLAARAAEGAFVLGGPEAYWKMHIWLMSNQQGFGPDAVRRGAAAIGLDADALVSAMERPEVQGAITDDLNAAAAMNVGQIPCVYINGKFVKRWSREGDNIVERIIDEASVR